MNTYQDFKIAVIGLGYVGLPLAVEFGKKFQTIGFDINRKRIEDLLKGIDLTKELTAEQLKDSQFLELSNDLSPVGDCNVFIITVPTPVDKANKPDLTPVIKATEMVGRLLKRGDIVIYESTVYPGCTEEDCVPVLEKIAQLKFNIDFFCGYSPERINPGDKEHTVTKIKKVTSGSTPEIAETVDFIYRSIITAGTHKAPSIKVAEAAKVIENSQRDINIAFINELSKIFNLLGIDTNEVLEAAGTKWNFLHFKPGLVGGHCIGVDPYYLAQKAQSVGYHPEIILAGRRLNDSMGLHVANEVVKLMIKKEIPVNGSKALILGFTFKENCPDIRNTKVIDVYHELKSFGLDIDVYDPNANAHDVKNEYGISMLPALNSTQYKAIILAVAHQDFNVLDFTALKDSASVIFDIKSILPKHLIDARL